jgi:hypothetical protein
MSSLFFDAMNAAAYTAPVPEVEAVRAQGLFQPELSVLSSLAFAAVILGIAAYEFRKMDY